MARRRRAEVRQLQPDLVYGDVLVTAFINKIMRDGKKNLAARIFYDACKIIQEKTGQEPSRSSSRRWRTSSPGWRSVPAAWAGPTTRSPWRSPRGASSPWP